MAGWSRNGRELYYVDSDTGQMMAVETQTGSDFHAGQPQAMFKMPDPSNASTGYGIFDVSPDPKRFLVTRPEEAAIAGSTLIVTTKVRRSAEAGAGEPVRGPATQSTFSSDRSLPNRLAYTKSQCGFPA